MLPQVHIFNDDKIVSAQPALKQIGPVIRTSDFPESRYSLLEVFNMWKPPAGRSLTTVNSSGAQRLADCSAASRILTLVGRCRRATRIWWEAGTHPWRRSRRRDLDREAPETLPRYDLPRRAGHARLRRRPHALRHVGAGSPAGAARRRERRGRRRSLASPAGAPVAGLGAGPGLGRQRLARAPGPARARRGARGSGLPRLARRSRRLGEHRGARGRRRGPEHARSLRRSDRAGRRG